MSTCIIYSKQKAFWEVLFLIGRGTRTLRFAFGLLALRASLPLGGAPLPPKTPTPRRFLNVASSPTRFKQKKWPPNGWSFLLAGALGLEPRRTVLETAMLPLHHAPMMMLRWLFKVRMQYCNWSGDKLQALFSVKQHWIFSLEWFNIHVLWTLSVNYRSNHL